MTTLTHSRGVQYPVVASFDFTMADAMVNTSGTLTNFNATSGTVFGVIPLPYGAVVTDGHFDVIAVSNTGTSATIKFGNSVDTDMWSDNTTIDLTVLGRTKLLKTGTVITAQSVALLGESVLATLANVGTVATAGTFKLVVEYIVTGRQHENARTATAAGYLV